MNIGKIIAITNSDENKHSMEGEQSGGSDTRTQPEPQHDREQVACEDTRAHQLARPTAETVTH